MKKIPAHFINVDLGLKSTGDLSPLIEAWTNRAVPIHVCKDGRRNWVRFELTAEAKDPAEAILGVCTLVRPLPNAGRVLWKNKHVFDFNQGLMDFGATVCTARKPKCSVRPMARTCRSFRKLSASAQP